MIEVIEMVNQPHSKRPWIIPLEGSIENSDNTE